jgi:prepilin-type N-terminal cleavage/methylation domain-containing protein
MRKGFTLIELLVVIAIISIIASFTVVIFFNARVKGRDAKRVSDIRQVQQALDIYFNDNGVYPSAITAGNTFVGPNSITYMQRVPAPPGVNDGACISDPYTYSSTAPYSVYTLTYCLGGVVQNIGPGSCVAVTGNNCSTPPPVVGDSYGGGIVAYLFVNGDTGYVAGETHGLIAATSDQSTGVAWGCSGTSITTATAIGEGNTNTVNIMAGCATAGIAARLCGDLSSGGYDDWYLPSRYDVGQLYISRVAIGLVTNADYVSSSQSNASSAYYLYGITGITWDTYPKANSKRVRCVRTF